MKAIHILNTTKGLACIPPIQKKMNCYIINILRMNQKYFMFYDQLKQSINEENRLIERH